MTTPHGKPDPEQNAEPNIDALLDRAIEALNDGDRTTATELAEQVLAVDSTNNDAEDLLAAPTSGGEMRRLTIFFADLVDSTVLSTRTEPEVYRTVVGRYREHVLRIVDRYEGHIGSTKGDGLLAVFGHPRAHENDVKRAVQAGLEITRAVAKLSEQTQRRFGFGIDVRVGVHRGLVYLDTKQDDVYGLAANFAARVSSLAPPGSVVVSGVIEPLLRRDYELEPLPSQTVKGIEAPVEHHRVAGEKFDRPRIAQGPLIGRQHQLDEFKRMWHDASTGTPSDAGLALIGEPGLGKSRLATAAAAVVERSGGTVITLFGSPFHTDSGLHPVRTLLERRCGIGRTTSNDERVRLLEAELASIGLDPVAMVPLLAPVLGLTSDTGYERASSDGRKLYQRISKAVRQYLVACLGDTPGLILVEDLHWFDPSTLDVITAMLRTRRRGLLLLLTTRQSERLPEGVTPLPLAPLTDAETDDLIAAVDPTLSDADRAEVRQRCDGVPLYIEEVVAKLSAGQRKTTRETQWERVPDALYEPLFARLRASDNAVPVVVAAATIGREVDRAMLMSVLALSEAELSGILVELENARVFEPIGADAWRFRHELLREVAAELPPPSQRKLLHSRIADVIAELPGAQSDWRELAMHYGHAERFEQAADAYQNASADARRRGALSEARGYLTHCLEHIEQLPPGRLRNVKEIAARLRRGFLISAAEGTTSPEAAADFERCLELAGTAPSREMAATMTALYSYYLTRCDLRRADELLKSVRTITVESRDWMRPVNESGVAQLAWFRGDFAGARSRLEDCAAAGDLVSAGELERTWFMPHEPIAGIHTNLALARFINGDVAGTEAALAEVERRCQQLTFPHGPFTLAYANTLEAWIAMEAQQFERANHILDDLMASSEKHGFDGWLLIAAAQRAAVSALATLAADTVDAAVLKAHLEALGGALDLLRAVHLVTFLTVFEAVLARIWLATGHPERGRERIDMALVQADETGLDFYRAELLRHRAATWPDPAQRDDDLAAAVELAQQQDATIFALRAAVDTFTVDPERGRGLVIGALSRFPHDSAWPELASARALLQ